MTFFELLEKLAQHEIEMRITHDLPFTRVQLTRRDENQEKVSSSMAFSLAGLPPGLGRAMSARGIGDMVCKMIEFCEQIDASREEAERRKREEQKTRMSEYLDHSCGPTKAAMP